VADTTWTMGVLNSVAAQMPLGPDLRFVKPSCDALRVNPIMRIVR
jgi:hypothetical protein